MDKYESMEFGYFGWSATTFGCGCCQGTDEIEGEDATALLENIAKMYQEKADRYWRMAEIDKVSDILGVYLRWQPYKTTKSRLETHDRAIKGEDCGRYGREMVMIGESTLANDFAIARRALHEDDEEIAELMGW